MEELKKKLVDIFDTEDIIMAVISGPRKKGGLVKIDIKPVKLKTGLKYQVSMHDEKKVFHKNLDGEIAAKEIADYMKDFKQCQLFTSQNDYQLLVNKNLSPKLIKKKSTRAEGVVELSHNRTKKYIINEGEKCDFLIKLGVMNNEGKVLAQKQDKFKQINKFLELVRDVVKNLEDDKELQIIDFGCGKSYLTFALYYYLKVILKRQVRIYGLDLKEDVIEFCNRIAVELGYTGLEFFVGDIAGFEKAERVDMVVTLHACDTATDAALIKAVEWQSKVILSVPCCQHELFGQIENQVMKPLLKHGIIKERISALVTDASRAQVLELLGYTTQVIEFIDAEHTPKNLMIKAIKTGKAPTNQKLLKEYMEFKEFWNISPAIEKLIYQGKNS